jgi:hypothetical protein
VPLIPLSIFVTLFWTTSVFVFGLLPMTIAYLICLGWSMKAGEEHNQPSKERPVIERA